MKEILDIRNTNRKKNVFDGQMFKQTGHCQGNISVSLERYTNRNITNQTAFHLTYTIL